MSSVSGSWVTHSTVGVFKLSEDAVVLVVDGTSLEVTGLWDTLTGGDLLQEPGGLVGLVESVPFLTDLTVGNGDSFLVGLLELVDYHSFTVVDDLVCDVWLETSDSKSRLVGKLGNVSFSASHALGLISLTRDPVVIAVFDLVGGSDWSTGGLVIEVERESLLTDIAETGWETWELKGHDAVVHVLVSALGRFWDNLVSVAVEADSGSALWILAGSETGVIWAWSWDRSEGNRCDDQN
jgi:hypothetical protein